MEILINHKVIRDSPYNGSNEDFFVFDDEDLISQIMQEILNGTPTCFLVSGYRGVGKTSFIKRVEIEIKNQNKKVVFTNINFSKYESYSFLLRKIIREVYLSISATLDLDELKKQDKEVITSLELLFERTFHEVLESQKKSLKQEYLTTTNIQVNIKKLSVAFLFLIGAGINNNFNFITSLLGLSPSTYLDFILFCIPIIWTAFELINIKKTINRNNTDLLEISRKNLYDDEIAEYHLNKILKDLNSLGIQPIFIIDELDKIEDTEKVETLIAELKPIMLSGLASFILVSGQNLYYKFHTAHILDDALIASIFSKTIHIPLLSTRKFFELFSIIINSNNQVEERYITDYLKSKILNSNRLPRRFLNLIRQDLIWKENKTYLEVTEEDKQIYTTDAQLLEIIDYFYENELVPSGYSAGITDFFITQLHIWIQKMKLKGATYFSKDDIYNIENDYKVSHPSWYFTRLNALIVNLLEKMYEDGLLDKKAETVDGEEILYYKWTESATIKTEAIINEYDELQSSFLMRFIEFEKYLREIYLDISKDNDTSFSVLKIVERLVMMGMLPKIWSTDELRSLVILRNKISHGQAITLNDFEILQNNTFEINKMSAHLIEEYTYYITKLHLEQFGYFLTKELTEILYKNVFDFRARRKSNNSVDILFLVKLMSTKNVALKKDLLYKNLKHFESYTDQLGTKSFLVYFVYTRNGKGTYNKFEEQLRRILVNEFPHLKNYVIPYHISGDVDQNEIKFHLNQLLEMVKIIN